MAITVKYLEGLGVDKEVAEKIFAERSGEIEKEKAKYATLEKELQESKESLENLTTEFETLKTANADGADWKAKFEALQAENEAKAKKAEADRILKEKNESIEKRFNECVGNKQFNHEAIRADYLKKFADALESKDFEGKGDSDIFKELTQNDGTAFRGVVQIPLAGGSPRPTGKSYHSKDEIMAIKDRVERRQAIAENPSLFGINKE